MILFEYHNFPFRFQSDLEIRIISKGSVIDEDDVKMSAPYVTANGDIDNDIVGFWIDEDGVFPVIKRLYPQTEYINAFGL